MAQNANSTNTYDTVPALPYDLTLSMLRLDQNESSPTSPAPDDPGVVKTIKDHTSVGAATIAKAFSYVGVRKKSPQSSGAYLTPAAPIADHAASLSTDPSVGRGAQSKASGVKRNSESVVKVWLPPSDEPPSVVSSLSPSLTMDHAASPHAQLPVSVNNACSGTSALIAGAL